MSTAEVMANYGPLLLAALATTLRICFIATAIAMLLGFAMALALRSRSRSLAWLARIYVEIMRGTPILVVLFLLYYGGPTIGLTLDAEPVGILGLSLYGAGYFAEIFRAGLQSIPVGQVEAARMLGISPRHIVARIQAPQMLRLVVPPSINQVIVLIKESAALSIITVPEITKVGAQIANETFAVVAPYLIVALLYWLVVEAVATVGFLVERQVRY
jgi:polar amino acid transport system permease protein